MATAADLDSDPGYRVPKGFFTSGLSENDPAVEEGSAQSSAASRPRSS